MQISDRIHTLELPFKIPITPDRLLPRKVFVTIVYGDRIALIDSGVKGSERNIFEAIRQQNRSPDEIDELILSHSHPDHIGSAPSIKEVTGCRIFAAQEEKKWIEDTAAQNAERPVPGFDILVEGPVTVDVTLADKSEMMLGKTIPGTIYTTPGHSPGSLSLLFRKERILFCGDAIPLPGDLPIYDDIGASLRSIRKIWDLVPDTETLISSWENPIYGRVNIDNRVKESVAYLKRIHGTVMKVHNRTGQEGMELCRQVVEELSLPAFAANPLVARAFMSSLLLSGREDLFV